MGADRVGTVIALAFRRGRIVFALLTLAAAHAAYTLLLEHGLNGAPARGVFAALCLFVPLNLAALCVLPERGSLQYARRAPACGACLRSGIHRLARFRRRRRMSSPRLYAPLFEPAPVISPVPQMD